MKILNCLFLCLLLNTSCSKPNYSAVEFANQAQVAYSKKNDKEAFILYKKAAELGNADAMFTLGTMYHFGEGVLKDPEEAFKWYKKAAELGNAEAMSSLGAMYYFGEGVLKDPKEAKYWVKKAYDVGNKDAEKAWNELELWKY
jgi:TPR repeat protein